MNESIEHISSGREILKALEAEGKYVFHGSSNPNLETLEPRQAYDEKSGERVEDDKPAIHASPFCDIAILMGIINKQNCPDGFDKSFAYKNGPVLSVSQQALDQLNKNSIGYVYVFSKDDFAERGKLQSISYTEVKPIQMVKVGKVDLMEDIQIL